MDKVSVLLLGGTGTLSRAVLAEAISSGYVVSVMNRGHNNSSLPIIVDTIVCDFMDKDRLNSTFCNRHFDVIVDFLSRTSEDIERVYPIFYDKCCQYIFISSACVFKRAEADFPITEDSPMPNSNWSYNLLKYQAEQKLISLACNNKSVYTIARPYITYDDERIPVGIAPAYKYHRTIIERLKAGKPWFTWGDKENITTVTHTIDFSRMLVGLFMNDRAANQCFNLVGDYSCTQSKLVEILFNSLELKVNSVNIPVKEFNRYLPEYEAMLSGDRALKAVFDNTKIKETTQCGSSKIDIDSGVKRVINHWQNELSFQYDYQFDARIDRLLSHYTKVKFVKYPNSNRLDIITYYAYRYLPLRIANKLIRILKHR